MTYPEMLSDLRRDRGRSGLLFGVDGVLPTQPRRGALNAAQHSGATGRAVHVEVVHVDVHAVVADLPGMVARDGWCRREADGKGGEEG